MKTRYACRECDFVTDHPDIASVHIEDTGHHIREVDFYRMDEQHERTTKR